MARLKIPDVSNPQEKTEDTHTTGEANINNTDNSEGSNLDKADFSKDSLNEELTNARPVILTQDQYTEMFGDSGEDENDHSFHGFEEDSRPIKNTKMTPVMEKKIARRFFKRQLSPTDESNPYKKKYLNYMRDRGKSRKQVTDGCYSLPDKENKLSLSNDCQQQRTNNINKTAKHLVNKAYMVKRKTLISPLKVNSKYSLIARPRRKQKLNFNSDFIYDPPSKKPRLNKEKSTDFSASGIQVKAEIEETVTINEDSLKPKHKTKIPQCPGEDKHMNKKRREKDNNGETDNNKDNGEDKGNHNTEKVVNKHKGTSRETDKNGDGDQKRIKDDSNLRANSRSRHLEGFPKKMRDRKITTNDETAEDFGTPKEKIQKWVTNLKLLNLKLIMVSHAARFQINKFWKLYHHSKLSNGNVNNKSEWICMFYGIKGKIKEGEDFKSDWIGCQ